MTDEYKNCESVLKYVCPKGHKSSTNWHRWKRGQRCRYCGYKKAAPKMSLGIETVRSAFSSEGYMLLNTEYKNNTQKLRYICSEGHEYRISWVSWKNGARCAVCSGTAKHSIEFVRRSFGKEGCKLLSKTYKNNKTKLYYICSNGHTASTTWNDWVRGFRCRACWFERSSGSTHHNWKGGITCEPYCDIWLDKEYKESIKDRDGHKCLNPDCRNNYKTLNIHHIDYNKKSCGPENLITLCTSCNARANFDRRWHKAWYRAILHRRYGYNYG